MLTSFCTIEWGVECVPILSTNTWACLSYMFLVVLGTRFKCFLCISPSVRCCGAEMIDRITHIKRNHRLCRFAKSQNTELAKLQFFTKQLLPSWIQRSPPKQRQNSRCGAMDKTCTSVSVCLATGFLEHNFLNSLSVHHENDLKMNKLWTIIFAMGHWSYLPWGIDPQNRDRTQRTSCLSVALSCFNVGYLFALNMLLKTTDPIEAIEALVRVQSCQQGPVWNVDRSHHGRHAPANTTSANDVGSRSNFLFCCRDNTHIYACLRAAVLSLVT